MVPNNAVNHHTYPYRANREGTVACVKRNSERVSFEIKSNMGRLTNLYKFVLGSEVPHCNYSMFLSSRRNYVVFPRPDRLEQAAPSRRLSNEDPKFDIRRKALELGMPRKAKVWGVRRPRSTYLMGKGASQSSVRNLELNTHGFKESPQLEKLKFDIKNNNQITNLSIIMSDPEFLIGCWKRIASNQGSLTPSLTADTLDGIDREWFEEAASGILNGKFRFSPSRRTYIPKPGKIKKRPLTIPNPRDKIIQEAMRFLLELVYETSFKNSSHGFRPRRGCGTALHQISRKFGNIHWFIEGDIDQQFPSINHNILVNIIKQKVKDQPFFDMLYKYLRVGYGEDVSRIIPMKLGLTQGGVLSPLLSNIYMNEFDSWMEDILIPNFNSGKRRKANPLYSKLIRSGSAAEARKMGVQSTLGNDPNYKRLRYVRYADDFLIGISGSRQDCIDVRLKIKDYLNNKLNLDLNLEKTKITHATNDAAHFLGYIIHLTKIDKMPVKKNSKGIITRIVPRPRLEAPIKNKVNQLYSNGFATKHGVPTRNGKFIHLSLVDLINHFRDIERGILNYYSLANNYSRMAARIHYILKYSCALTIASKMRLHTKKRVFSKYGANLEIKDENGDTLTSYPAPSYKRKKHINKLNVQPESLISNLTRRIGRGRKDIKGPCVRCGATEAIEIHHVRKLSRRKKLRKKDWLKDLMIRMNRKQIPLCKSCHIKLHRGNGL